MSKLTTAAEVLAWAKDAAEFDGECTGVNMRITATAERIAENERFRQAYSAFRFSAVTETSEEILWRLLDEMRAVLKKPEP